MEMKEKMLKMLLKGKVPTKENLKMGKEEFVQSVTEAVNDGLIENVYISFCDSSDTSNLLSGARLTDKGIAEARKVSWFRRS